MGRQTGGTPVLRTVGGRAAFPPSSLSRGASWLGGDSCPSSQLRTALLEPSARSSARSCLASSSAIVSSPCILLCPLRPGSHPTPALPRLVHAL